MRAVHELVPHVRPASANREGVVAGPRTETHHTRKEYAGDDRTRRRELHTLQRTKPRLKPPMQTLDASGTFPVACTESLKQPGWGIKAATAF